MSASQSSKLDDTNLEQNKPDQSAVPTRFNTTDIPQAPKPERRKQIPLPDSKSWPRPPRGDPDLYPGRVFFVQFYNGNGTEESSTLSSAFPDTKSLCNELEWSESLPAEMLPTLRIIHSQNARWAEKVLAKRFRFQCCEGIPELPDHTPIVNTWLQNYWDAVTYLNNYELRGSTSLQQMCFTTPLTERRTQGVRGCGFCLYNVETSGPRVAQTPLGDTISQRRALRLGELSNTDQLVAVSVWLPLNAPSRRARAEDQADDDPHRSLPADRVPTVLIFDNSRRSSPFFEPEDDLCFIKSESAVEGLWRRLTLRLPREIAEPREATLNAIDLVVTDIFDALLQSWNKRISVASSIVDTLQPLVYDNPVDDSRAPELWRCNAEWMKARRLANQHLELIKSFRSDLLGHLDDVYTFDAVTRSVNDLGRIPQRIENELIETTTAMSNTIYQAVSFRDAKISLQLNTSLWRLSWITFIFLPLTFVSGFFGMNVDTFEGNPSIKWYFVAAIPLMATIMIASFISKHFPGSNHPTPHELSRYDRIFRQLAVSQPHAFTVEGPIQYFKPEGIMGRVRFRLLKRWFHPSKLVPKPEPMSELGEASLGPWTKIKCILLEHWGKQIQGKDQNEVARDGKLKEGSSDA